MSSQPQIGLAIDPGRVSGGLSGGWVQSILAPLRGAEGTDLAFVTVRGASGDRWPFRLSEIEFASYLIALLPGIAVIPVSDIDGAEPFHLANQLSSLDWAANGATAWWPRSASSGSPHDADELIAAVSMLWDSWEDDFIVNDRATGRFLDRDRLHHIDFRGRSVSVRGPALAPRPVQGRLPLIASGGSAWHPPGWEIVAPGGGAQARSAGGGDAWSPRFADIEVTFADARPGRLEERDGILRYRGSPAGLAEDFGRVAEHAELVRLVPESWPRDVTLLLGEGLSRLGRAGFLGARRGGTLRERLGLARPPSSFAHRGGGEPPRVRATIGGGAAHD